MSEVMSAKARLNLAREILAIRSGVQAGATIAAKVLVNNRIGSIRRVLLGREGWSILDELMSPSMSRNAIDRVLEESKSLPPVEAVAVSKYVEAIVESINAVRRAELSQGAPTQQHLPVVGSVVSEEVKNALVDAQIERGRLSQDIKDRMPEFKELADKALSINHDVLLKEHAPEVYALREAVQDESNRLHKAYRDNSDLEIELSRQIRAKISNKDDEDEIAELIRQKNSLTESNSLLYKKYSDHWDGELRKALDAAKDAVKQAQAKLEAPLVEAAQSFTQSVIDASPVSEEQAKQWADSQDVTQQAKARLKKIGYPVEKLRQDMAEFYRFSGGRVAKVRIHSKGDRRANATDIEAHGKEGAIHLDSSFDKRILWHELAHHIEADPVAKLAAGAFIRRRSVDGKAYSLRSLSGHKGYRADEAAYKDHFFSHYVGKIYRDGITEVFSMGVESFSDPLTLGRRLVQDAETLEFVAGYLKQPIHPLARAHMSLRGRLIDTTVEANEALGNEVEQIQKKLAQQAVYVADTDDSWTEGGDISWYTANGKQVGKFPEAGFYLYEAKVRNVDTKRKVTGYRVFYPERSDRLDYMDRVVWRPRGTSGTNDFPTKDLDIVKAAIVIWQKTGWFPNWYTLNNVDSLRKYLQE